MRVSNELIGKKIADEMGKVVQEIFQGARTLEDYRGADWRVGFVIHGVSILSDFGIRSDVLRFRVENRDYPFHVTAHLGNEICNVA